MILSILRGIPLVDAYREEEVQGEKRTVLHLHHSLAPIKVAGLPLDFQSLEDKQVAIRERDSLAQIRVPIEGLEKAIEAKLKGQAFDASALGYQAEAMIPAANGLSYISP